MTTVPESRSRGRTLRERCIGRTESAIVGVASTAPAYSLAVTVGLLVSYVGAAAPLVLLIAAVPILGMVLCFRELNLSEPDCGTVFAWTQRIFGVGTGRMVGWCSIMACVLVMGNLAQVAAIYAYDLVGWDAAADSRGAQALLGVVFIGILAYLAYRGIEVAARVQAVLLTGEVLALVLFAIAAYGKSTGGVSFSTHGHHSWGLAILAAVFLYWGWDSSFSMNEESESPTRTPAFGALAANAVLIVLYFVVTMFAVLYAGVDRLAGIKEGDFFAVLGNELIGSVGGKILIGMVLFSALASTQTTILPTARTMLSMARKDAFPGRFARISRRYRTPSVSTVVFAGVSSLVYVTLVLISDSVLQDSVSAVAILVSIYYLATALAVPFYFIKQETEPGVSRPFPRVFLRVVVPVFTTMAFVVILCFAMADITTGALITVVISLVVGAALMFSMRPPVDETVTP